MIRRSPIRRTRSKPRRGRLDAEGMTKLRKFVFKRDGYKCQQVLGGKPGDPGATFFYCLRPVTWDSGHLCHRTSRGAGGHDTPENTFCGCAEHHRMFHERGPSLQKPVPSKRGL